jgi:hypothetical protein
MEFKAQNVGTKESGNALNPNLWLKRHTASQQPFTTFPSPQSPDCEARYSKDWGWDRLVKLNYGRPPRFTRRAN